jgi:hypothetical protein
MGRLLTGKDYTVVGWERAIIFARMMSSTQPGPIVSPLKEHDGINGKEKEQNIFKKEYLSVSEVDSSTYHNQVLIYV